MTFKKAIRKIFKIIQNISQASTHSFIICLPRLIYIVHLVFHMFILKPVISNIFHSWSKLLLPSVVIDSKTEYKISWIKDSKIDCKQTCKLLYKVIWLGYKTMKEESNWLLISKLTYIPNLISDFHQAYLDKPSSLLLSQCWYLLWT